MSELQTYRLPAPGTAAAVDAPIYAEVREAIRAGDVRALEIVPANVHQTNLVNAATGQLVGLPMPTGLGRTGLGRVLADAIDVALAEDYELIVMGEAALYAATVGGDESAAGEQRIADRIAGLLKSTPLAVVLQSRHERGASDGHTDQVSRARGVQR